MSTSWTWKDAIALRRLATPSNTKGAGRSAVEREIRDALSDIIRWRRAIAREPIGGRQGARLVESKTVRRAMERERRANERGRGEGTERRSRWGDGDRARSKRRQAESAETTPRKERTADDPETGASQ
jgi:hypothetical protein